ncbi:MAG: hypothetical protein V3W31_00125 [Thermodesulfobacteriota bacterium]
MAVGKEEKIPRNAAATLRGRRTLFALLLCLFSFHLLPGTSNAEVVNVYISGNGGYYSNSGSDNGSGNGNGSGNYNGSVCYPVNRNYGGSGQPLVIKSIAMLPLENFSGREDAPELVAEYIRKELKGKGWVLITEEGVVERFLAKRRIRYTGAITRLTAREMGKVLGVDAVMVGSVDQYYQRGTRTVVGVTARMVSTADGAMVWADNLTYVGHDFETVLGLGVVGSLDTLSAMVTGDLVKSIADRFFIRDIVLSPFEIERVITYPPMAQAGEEVDLRVKIMPITDAPKEVVAMVGGREYALAMVGEYEYGGLVEVPDSEGLYHIDIVARDPAMTPFSFAAAGKVVVDDTAPEVVLALNKKVFSPRKLGGVKLTPELLNRDEIDEWSIDIVDIDGKVVRHDRGFGALPRNIVWKGEKDRGGMVEDGDYTYNFSVKDRAGNETLLTDVLRVRSRPPEIEVAVDMADEDIVMFSFDYDREEKIESWKLTITDRGGNKLKVMAGKGAIPEKLEYTLAPEHDLRKMAFSVFAKDEAGNTFKLRKAIPSAFVNKTPFAKLRKKYMKDF